MNPINLLCKFLNWTSALIGKNIDFVAVFYLFTWFAVSLTYFAFYDAVYYPNALVIEHYCDFSVAAWVFLFSHYNKMRAFGKATVLGFTIMLAVNSYQLHFGFEDTAYLLSFIAIVFALQMIVYAVCVSRYVREMFKPNFY